MFIFTPYVASGEKKLAKLATPDTWKAGARNVAGGKDGGRMIGENKALTVSTSSEQTRSFNRLRAPPHRRWGNDSRITFQNATFVR
jgi:hypothetical protein